MGAPKNPLEKKLIIRSKGQSLTFDIALQAHIIRYLRDNGHEEALQQCKITFSDVAFDRSVRLSYRLEDIVNKQLLRLSISPRSNSRGLHTYNAQSLRNWSEEKLYDPTSFVSFADRTFNAGWRVKNDLQRVKKSVHKRSFARQQTEDIHKMTDDGSLRHSTSTSMAFAPTQSEKSLKVMHDSDLSDSTNNISGDEHEF